MSDIKVCAHCGAENDAQAKFCQSCGSQLAKAKNRICSVCKTKNKPEARFCQNCGAPLQGAKKRVNKSTQGKSKVPVLILSAFLGFFILFIFIKSIEKPASQPNPNVPMQEELVTGDIALQASVMEIANQFWCACGSCNDSLEKCACPKAQEERSLILSELKKNTDKTKIVELVNKKYGLLKRDFKEFNSGS